MIFFIIPGVVIGIAWSLSLLLAVDKGINPVEAISKSNKATYGSKGTIFIAWLILSVIISILSAIVIRIPGIGIILYLAVCVVSIFVGIGMQAYVYKTLTADIAG